MHYYKLEHQVVNRVELTGFVALVLTSPQSSGIYSLKADMGLQDFSVIKNLTFVFTGDAAKLRQDYESLLASVSQMNEFIGRMIIMMHDRGALTSAEMTEMIQHYTQLASPNLTLALTIARKKHNPLTLEQADRLETYIRKAGAGLPFSDDEINDYYSLVEEARREQATNPWPLIALGSFLLGLWLGSRKRRGH